MVGTRDTFAWAFLGLYNGKAGKEQKEEDDGLDHVAD